MMRRWLSPLYRPLPLVALVVLGACTSSNFKPETATSVNVATTLPEPTLADVYGNQRLARLGPGDKLQVSVFGLPDLDRTVTIDGAGMINLPLIGITQASGRTSNEVAADIQARLGQRYLQNPQVSVAVAESVSQRVTVYGAVNRPGAYVISGDATLTDAVSLASGTNADARLTEAVIFRTVNGRKMAARFDLNAITGGRMADPAVYPSDRIVVATDTSRGLLRDLAPLVPVAGLFFYVL